MVNSRLMMKFWRKGKWYFKCNVLLSSKLISQCVPCQVQVSWVIFYKQQINFEYDVECYSKKFSDKLISQGILYHFVREWLIEVFLFCSLVKWGTECSPRGDMWSTQTAWPIWGGHEESVHARRVCTQPWGHDHIQQGRPERYFFLRPALKIWLHTPSFILLANFYSLQL